MYFVKYMTHNGSLAMILKFIRRITLTFNRSYPFSDDADCSASESARDYEIE